MVDKSFFEKYYFIALLVVSICSFILLLGSSFFYNIQYGVLSEIGFVAIIELLLLAIYNTLQKKFNTKKVIFSKINPYMIGLFLYLILFFLKGLAINAEYMHLSSFSEYIEYFSFSQHFPVLAIVSILILYFYLEKKNIAQADTLDKNGFGYILFILIGIVLIANHIDNLSYGFSDYSVLLFIEIILLISLFFYLRKEKIVSIYSINFRKSPILFVCVFLVQAFFVVLVIFSSWASFAHRGTCQDGSGFDSYGPNMTEGYSGLFKFPPQDVIDNRIAYVYENNCHGMKYYFLKNGNEFNTVSKNKFYNYIEEYNTTCSGCMKKYISSR